MAVRKLFGTDGIRGSANSHPITPEIALRLGRAAGYLMREKGVGRPRFVIGRDTRRSGEMLEAALVAGLNSIGADVLLTGVIPTPAVACLVQEFKAEGGVVISASHNPAGDNGLKLFGSNGYKLDDALEERLDRAKNSVKQLTDKVKTHEQTIESLTTQSSVNEQRQDLQTQQQQQQQQSQVQAQVQVQQGEKLF